jgi:hypothetical protein
MEDETCKAFVDIHFRGLSLNRLKSLFGKRLKQLSSF